MYNYLVSFTNEVGTAIYGEYVIRDVCGQIDALMEARDKFLDDVNQDKKSMNFVGFHKDVTVKIVRVDDNGKRFIN